MKKPLEHKIDRFELEQQILDCWHVTDDLNILFEAITEKDLSKDEILNIIHGMKCLYHLKFEKCFDTFSSLITDRKII